MLARLDESVISQKPHWMVLSCGVNDVWHFKLRLGRQTFVGVPFDEYKNNITSIIDLGPYGSRLSRAIRFLVSQSVRRIDQKLVHLGPIPLEALKTRVAETILATPDYWRDDEAIAGEDGPPIEEQVLLDEIVSTVHAASSVLEIINGLFGESFEA